MNETASDTLPEKLANCLAISLLTLRVALGGFLLVWGLEKLITPATIVGLYKEIYFFDAPLTLLYAAGILECVLALAVIVGIYRTYSYGIAFLLHAFTVVFTIQWIVDPWGLISGKPQYLFLASVPVLAAFFVLFFLRDWDTYTLDERRAAGPGA